MSQRAGPIRERFLTEEVAKEALEQQQHQEQGSSKAKGKQPKPVVPKAAAKEVPKAVAKEVPKAAAIEIPRLQLPEMSRRQLPCSTGSCWTSSRSRARPISR